MPTPTLDEALVKARKLAARANKKAARKPNGQPDYEEDIKIFRAAPYHGWPL